MEKQFVSFDIALKLKELGFDEPCFAYFTKMKDWMITDYKGKPAAWQKYNVGNNMYLRTVTDSFGDNLHRDGKFVRNSKFTKAITNVAAPLYQQVIDWFRTKHNLFIELVIDRTAEPKFTYIITRYLGDFNWEESIMSEFLYRTYEESREDAILKAIGLCQK